jgi:hypothetical protein
MPIEKSRLDRIIDSVERYLSDHEKDIMAYYDEDRDTDPIQFGNPPRKGPVAEPPAEIQDSAPRRIHGSPRPDLFK